MKIAVVIPTLQAAAFLPPLLERLQRQTLSPARIVVVDSSSTDDTARLARAAGCTCKVIPRDAFDHGGTRNLGARLAQADILTFLTQDALPAGDAWLDTLTKPIRQGEAAAVFGRQLPRVEASLLESFARHFNYPETSELKRLCDLDRLGIKTFYFSNVCSAVRADAFWSVGGFPEHTILNEDAILAAKLLRQGEAVKYVAEARVWHSHDYSLAQQFRRYFDIGVSISQSAEHFAGARSGQEGLKFMRGQLRFVGERGRWELVPRVFAEAAAKFAAFHLGRREKFLPRAFKRRLSMHKHYWR